MSEGLDKKARLKWKQERMAKLHDLAGELWARGIDLGDVPSDAVEIVLGESSASLAADVIADGRAGEER